MFRDENKTEGSFRIKIWVDMERVEGIGLVFMTASFLEETISPEGIKEDQSTVSNLHSTVDELMKDAVALNNPSSKEQYTGKLEVQVEMT
jgi:hypothetical protein